MRKDLNQNERMFAKLFDLVVVQYKKLSKTSDFAETVGTAVTPKELKLTCYVIQDRRQFEDALQTVVECGRVSHSGNMETVA